MTHDSSRQVREGTKVAANCSVTHLAAEVLIGLDERCFIFVTDTVIGLINKARRKSECKSAGVLEWKRVYCVTWAGKSQVVNLYEHSPGCVSLTHTQGHTFNTALSAAVCLFALLLASNLDKSTRRIEVSFILIQNSRTHSAQEIKLFRQCLSNMDRDLVLLVISCLRCFQSHILVNCLTSFSVPQEVLSHCVYSLNIQCIWVYLIYCILRYKCRQSTQTPHKYLNLKL